ncbi:MAG: Quinoprotein glucose dehydrogenase precursor [Planctomycetota bacterium]|jgi:glucose/arabinose dehydrogenase
MLKTITRGLLGLLLATGASSRGQEQILESPLPVRAERAFPNLDFNRPIVVTHAGDGTNRVFVAEQEGIIRVFANDQDTEESSVFLDIDDRCVYADNQNEEGLLGFAFHPQFRSNGEFFLYYTSAEGEHISRVSRFRVMADNPNVADPASEEVILRIPQPFWNHNGGTIEFGPDGYLYIALGDGGSGNDPQGHGQNLTTLLGSILRIDVDRKEADRNYAIPKDNPFVGKQVKIGPQGKTAPAREEIYAYGVRNIWRMSFDHKTGTLWAADVGQNLWEEINIIQSGGNYGWNVREGRHWFRPDGNDGKRSDLIDPIFEYNHEVGKSITGGTVYRGTRVPELVGKYVYADYVSGRLWALDYDTVSGKVLGNYTLSPEEGGENLPVMSFGADETGDVYFTTPFGSLYRFRSEK